MYLITAYFDKKSNEIIKDYMNKIEKLTGNISMKDTPPHLTLAQINTNNEQLLIEVFNTINVNKGEIDLVSLGIFLPKVIYGNVILNEYLLNLSKEIYNKISIYPNLTLSDYYKPYSWIPHITLCKNIKDNELSLIIEGLKHEMKKTHIKITSIGLSKVSPYEDIGIIVL